MRDQVKVARPDIAARGVKGHVHDTLPNTQRLLACASPRTPHIDACCYPDLELNEYILSRDAQRARGYAEPA